MRCCSLFLSLFLLVSHLASIYSLSTASCSGEEVEYGCGKVGLCWKNCTSASKEGDWCYAGVLMTWYGFECLKCEKDEDCRKAACGKCCGSCWDRRLFSPGEGELEKFRD